MFLNFKLFIESFLKSNRQPLYHFTDTYNLLNIIKENKLNLGTYLNPYNNKEIKFISLTRNTNLKLTHKYSNIRITLNDKIYQKYKIIPYDFFIHSKKEFYTKSDIRRKFPIEYEEIILEPILNLSDFISEINFEDLYFLKNINLLLYDFLKENKHIVIKIKDKHYDFF